MKRLTITQGTKLPTPKEIIDFEKKYGLKMPEQFKSFLLEQNPASIAENIFPLKSGQKFIHDFFPFTNEGNLSLQATFVSLKHIFGQGFIAFANDPGGWLYVLSLRENDYGKVYFCRMDEELEDALTLLTHSFEEFINSLEMAKEE